jgi:hypothetical protein
LQRELWDWTCDYSLRSSKPIPRFPVIPQQHINVPRKTLWQHCSSLRPVSSHNPKHITMMIASIISFMIHFCSCHTLKSPSSLSSLSSSSSSSVQRFTLCDFKNLLLEERIKYQRKVCCKWGAVHTVGYTIPVKQVQPHASVIQMDSYPQELAHGWRCKSSGCYSMFIPVLAWIRNLII